jgi:hypothetical protein
VPFLGLRTGHFINLQGLLDTLNALAEETSVEDEEIGMDNEHPDATLETDNSRQVWQRPRERSHKAEV